jgi:hypothetical protein
LEEQELLEQLLQAEVAAAQALQELMEQLEAVVVELELVVVEETVEEFII